jgi:hypothetical protein
MTQSRKYVLISPCRDEAKYMRRTLDSVAAQSVPPTLWIVIDDGSTDETPRILEEYAAKLPYLRVVKRANRGARKVGPGVIEAFYDGLAAVNLDDFDYLCKLDLDLDLPPRYFETLIERMEQNPRIGTTSGKPYFTHPRSGKLVPETCGDEMSVGMTKFYRTECFQEIGGFVREVMWDGIDCHNCRLLGWIAESIDTPELRFQHLRPMGSSQKSIWTGRVRFGFGQYFMGSSPVYFLVSQVYRLPHHPVVYGSVASTYGYFKSAINGNERYGTEEFRTFLRRYQHLCLRYGKKEATRRTDEAQEAVWHQRRAAASGVARRGGNARGDADVAQAG